MTSLSKSPRFGAMFPALGAPSPALLAKLHKSGLMTQCAMTRLGEREITIYATGAQDVRTLENAQADPEKLAALAEVLTISQNPKAHPVPEPGDVEKTLDTQLGINRFLRWAGVMKNYPNEGKGYFYRFFPWPFGRDV